MAKVVQITAENFEEEVIKASETRAVAILFSSAEYPDCAPYSQLAGQLSTSMDFTLGVVSCDDRENMRLIQMFRVQSVPEIHVVDKGQIADVIQGVLPEADLKKRLEKFYVSEEARFQTALEDAIAQKNFDQALPMLDEAFWNCSTSTPKLPRRMSKVKKLSSITKLASSPAPKISKALSRLS